MTRVSVVHVFDIPFSCLVFIEYMLSFRSNFSFELGVVFYWPIQERNASGSFLYLESISVLRTIWLCLYSLFI